MEETEKNCQRNSTKKVRGPDSFIAGFYLSFKNQIVALLLRLLQAIEKDEKSSNSFYKLR